MCRVSLVYVSLSVLHVAANILSLFSLSLFLSLFLQVVKAPEEEVIEIEGDEEEEEESDTEEQEQEGEEGDKGEKGPSELEGGEVVGDKLDGERSYREAL